jgi:hypothetical protein
MPLFEYETSYTPFVDAVDHGYLSKLKPGDTCRLWAEGGIRDRDLIHRRVIERLRGLRYTKGWDVKASLVDGALIVRRYADVPNFVKPIKKAKGRPEQYPALRRIRPQQWLRFRLDETPTPDGLEVKRIRSAVARFNKANPTKRLVCRWFDAGLAVYRQK